MNLSNLSRNVSHSNKRHLWAWLNIIWNSVDRDRIKSVGPDRACAEWLMKNGAFVKWRGDREFVQHYDSLPEECDIRYIQEVDATNASLMHHGFQYFEQCKHIQKLKLHKCWLIDNKALSKLKFLKDSLQYLQVSGCPDVTDSGLSNLKVLNKLKMLILFDLMSVENLEKCAKELKQELPDCEFKYCTPDQSAPCNLP